MFARHLAANVRYVETSFHLPVTRFIGVPGPEIIAALRSAAPPGLEVRMFAGMLRSDYDGPLRPTIDDLENWDGLAGVDLHGFEAMPTEPWSARVWARLRAAGKVTKCHAGEFGGPERVREAIEQLGVTRIQHGVRAVGGSAGRGAGARAGRHLRHVPDQQCAAAGRALDRRASPAPAAGGGRALHGEHGRSALLRQHDPATNTTPWPPKAASPGPSWPRSPAAAGRSPRCRRRAAQAGLRRDRLPARGGLTSSRGAHLRGSRGGPPLPGRQGARPGVPRAQPHGDPAGLRRGAGPAQRPGDRQERRSRPRGHRGPLLCRRAPGRPDARMRSRWTSSSRTGTCSRSTRRPAWSCIRAPAPARTPWSTPCWRTAPGS